MVSFNYTGYRTEEDSLKSKNTKTQPISKKATRNPKTADAGLGKEVQSIKSREIAGAQRNEKSAAAGGQKRIQGHQAASSRRSQGKRDVKNG